tara:strand:+ start:39 stop:320 length:282 start_codon:yes stop_codon:yes gene_type:complete
MPKKKVTKPKDAPVVKINDKELSPTEKYKNKLRAYFLLRRNISKLEANAKAVQRDHEKLTNHGVSLEGQLKGMREMVKLNFDKLTQEVEKEME